MPLRNKNLFTGLGVCADCGWKLRTISDRKVKKLICGNYSTDSQKCSRNAIKIEDIVYLISNHYALHNKELELSNDFLIKEIKQITYSTNKGLIIEFNNDLPNIIAKENLLKFTD